jgi:group I intron endonuclease
MYGIIYCATCLRNGKKYFGKTTKSLSVRIAKHKYSAKYQNSYFYNAASKYGWSAFKWEVVDEACDKEELNSREKQWIYCYDSTSRTKGYNIQKGGQGNVHSEETKMKIGNANRGTKNYMFGRTGTNHHLFGTHPSDVTIQKLIDSHKGKKLNAESVKKRSETRRQHGWNRNPKKRGSDHPCAKPLFQISKEGQIIREWGSTVQAEQELGFGKGNIGRACRINGTAYGYAWRYK